MNTLIKNILFPLCLFFTGIISAHAVTVDLYNVSFNTGTNVGHCQTINIGSNSTVWLNGQVKLSKPHNQVIGTANLIVYLENTSTGNRQNLYSAPVNANEWAGNPTSEVYRNVPFNISASDVSTNGNNRLYVVLTPWSNNLEYKSCFYPVTKTAAPPAVTFRISPKNLEIECGTTNAFTFTAVNVNNSPGTATYTWNVGTGWATSAGTPVSGTISSTSNTLSLVPHTYPLSDISVTPILNNVARGTYTTAVSMKAYFSNATITGDASICSGSKNYVINGVSANETVSWSTSNPFISSVSNFNGTQTALSLIMDGEVTLKAEVANACGQTSARTKLVTLGTPVITSPLCFSKATPIAIGIIDDFPDPSLNSNCSLCRTNNFNTLNVIRGTATGGHGLYWEWQQLTNNFYMNTYANEAHFLPYQNGVIRFRVRATNGCGTAAWKDFETTISRACVFGGDDGIFGFRTQTNSNVYKLYPNPASTIVYVELADRSNSPDSRSLVTAELLDFYGITRSKVRIENNQAKIDVSRFPKGNYVLNINIDGQIESHQIVVE